MRLAKSRATRSSLKLHRLPANRRRADDQYITFARSLLPMARTSAPARLVAWTAVRFKMKVRAGMGRDALARGECRAAPRRFSKVILTPRSGPGGATAVYAADQTRAFGLQFGFGCSHISAAARALRPPAAYFQR